MLTSPIPEKSADVILVKVLAKWRANAAARAFAAEVPLWRAPGQTIYVDAGWGPPIPYPAVEHARGGTNHGYRRVKGNLTLVAEIPETYGFPELAAFLIAANGPNSPLESAGCDCGFLPPDQESEGLSTLGSYIDLIFSDDACNRNAEFLLEVAAILVAAAAGGHTWGGYVEIGLQRRRYLGKAPPMCLTVRVSGRAPTEIEARQAWSRTLTVIGQAM